MSKESRSPELLITNYSQDLAAGALNITTSWGKKFTHPRITFQATEAITENITLTLKNPYGTARDVVLDKESLNAGQSYVYPDMDNIDRSVYEAGFELQLQCTNANATGTVSGTLSATKK